MTSWAVGASLRRLALTAHVVASVGWLGAVGVFVALGVVGLSSDDAETVRAAYLAMEPTAWLVLVPLAAASLVTGVMQSALTPWGFFLHYWVVFKLAINVLSTVVLLLYMGTFGSLADLAADPKTDVESVRSASPLLHASLASLLLVVATTLGIYKPRGLTPYGRRKLERPAKRA